MNKKKLIIYIIIAIVLITLGITGYIVYKNYQDFQEKELQRKINTVAEVDGTNLKVEYNKEYTNKNLEIKLNTTTEYSIYYKLNNEDDYLKYESEIILQENATIYVKYINEYNTFSKEDYVIEITNIDKEKPNIITKNTTTTTSELTIEIDANDNVGIEKIEVSIDNQNFFEVNDKKYTFEKLNENKEYTINIKITDKAGNVTEDKITDKTKETNKSNTASNNSNVASSNTNSSKQDTEKVNVDNYVYKDSIDYLMPKAQENMSKYRGKANEVLGYINQYRAEVGANPLVIDENLMKVAMIRALDISYGNKFEHIRPNGDGWGVVIEQLGLHFAFQGENIAWGYSTPQMAANGWKNSPGHYQNLTTPGYTITGIGVSYYNGKYYWVQIFAD